MFDATICVALNPDLVGSSLAVRNLHRRPCNISSHDACRSLHHDHSTGINYVTDELAPCLVLKETPREHSDVCVCTYLSANTFSRETPQAVIFGGIARRRI